MPACKIEIIHAYIGRLDGYSQGKK